MNEDIAKNLRQGWQQALEAIETVLQERPVAHMREIAHAVDALVRVRDRLIEFDHEQGLSPEARLHLDKINAMLSVIASLEYPLAGLHWQRIEKVRKGLDQMLQESKAVTS